MSPDQPPEDDNDSTSRATSELVTDQAAANGNDGDASGSPSQTQSPQRKRQKRNKPTLSCAECVERKTKCDRVRPNCWSCVKRQSSCRYSEIADIIASAAAYDGASPRRTNNAGNVVSKTARQNRLVPAEHRPNALQQQLADLQIPRLNLHQGPSTTPSFPSLPLLLSNLPHAVSSIFGEGQAHPFSNYWSHKGGLPEVVGVLPSKEQADILVQKYFETIDAVYPIINKAQFLADYNHFWGLPTQQKNASDPALLGLHFVVYAMGTQFMDTHSDQERKQVAEFYASAAHQALRISSYLNRGSFATVQALVMLCYFLMNDNKASDAWGFGGILVRHVYAMGLNRDPEAAVPQASLAEKQQRRKLWQAVLFQDTFLTVLLRLPPTTTLTDVDVESLADDPDTTQSLGHSETTPPINPMSIRSIAPSPSKGTSASTSSAIPQAPTFNDCSYIRTMWKLANFVQPHICTPTALGLPMASSAAAKAQMVQEFEALFQSLPPTLTISDHHSFTQLAAKNPRQARQNLFARSNYWHCMMLIHVDSSTRHNYFRNFDGAIYAARNAISAFFHLWQTFRTDAETFWVFQHRGFEEALILAELLAEIDEKDLARCAASAGKAIGSTADGPLQAAKQDVLKVLDILTHIGGTAPEMQRSRTEVLKRVIAAIRW